MTPHQDSIMVEFVKALWKWKYPGTEANRQKLRHRMSYADINLDLQLQAQVLLPLLVLFVASLAVLLPRTCFPSYRVRDFLAVVAKFQNTSLPQFPMLHPMHRPL